MKATFCIFTFIRFLIEKCIKIQARMAAKKSTQHDALKDPNSSQNVWKFDDFGTEKKQICAQNVIFGCFLLWMIFRIAFLSFLDVIWSQNGVPGKNNFQTFASILEVKIVFLRPPCFLSILLSKISTKCSNSNLIT